MAKDYDLVVIGASPEGIATARIAARWQARVALVSDGAWQPHDPDQEMRDRLRQRLSLEAALDPPPPDLTPQQLMQEGVDVVEATAQVRRRHWVIAGDRRLLSRHILRLPPHATPVRDRLIQAPETVIPIVGSGTLALETLWVLQRAGLSVTWVSAGEPLPDWSEPSRQAVLADLREAGLSPSPTLGAPALELRGGIPHRDLPHLTERLRRLLFGVRYPLRPVPWRRLQLERTYLEIGAIAPTPACATPGLELFLSPRRGHLRGARLSGADADALVAVLAPAIARRQRLPDLVGLLPEGAIADRLQDLAHQWSRQRSLSGWRYQLLQEYFVFWRSTF